MSKPSPYDWPACLAAAMRQVYGRDIPIPDAPTSEPVDGGTVPDGHDWRTESEQDHDADVAEACETKWRERDEA